MDLFVLYIHTKYIISALVSMREPLIIKEASLDRSHFFRIPELGESWSHQYLGLSSKTNILYRVLLPLVTILIAFYNSWFSYYFIYFLLYLILYSYTNRNMSRYAISDYIVSKNIYPVIFEIPCYIPDFLDTLMTRLTFPLENIVRVAF